MSEAIEQAKKRWQDIGNDVSAILDALAAIGNRVTYLEARLSKLENVASSKDGLLGPEDGGDK